MEYDRVAAAEARHAAMNGSTRSRVEREVNAEIADRAEQMTRAEAERIERHAEELRGKAIRELVGTERAVRRARRLARLSQYIDYVFALLYSLLGIRLALAVIAANGNAGFVRLVREITDPFYSLFRGIVASPVAADGGTLAWPIVIAMVAYMLLHVAIKGFLHLVAHRRTAV